MIELRALIKYDQLKHGQEVTFTNGHRILLDFGTSSYKTAIVQADDFGPNYEQDVVLHVTDDRFIEGNRLFRIFNGGRTVGYGCLSDG